MVKRWHRKFCEKAYWIVKDADASKDIAQDTWNTIIDKLENLKNAESFGGWALRIFYNKSLDWIHAHNRKQNELIKYKNEHEVTDINDDNFDKLQKELLKTLIKLPNNHQVVLKLFYTQNYSLKEISNTFNISVGTAKSRLFHAREKLKLILKYKHYEN